MLFSLLCEKYIFFWFYQSVGFEVAAINKIVFTSSEAMVINLL